MTYDGSNRKQVREKEKAAALADSNRIATTRQIMGTIFGRAWMYDLLDRCHLFHTPFVSGAPDATAFNCGNQNVGLQIFSDVVTHCSTEYILMMQEATVKEQANERRNSDERSTRSEHSGSENSGRNDQGLVGEYEPFAEGGTEA